MLFRGRRRVPNSCKVAIEVGEHQIAIHFKNGRLFKLYVHPDNVVFTPSERLWSEKLGKEFIFEQNIYKACSSLELLCQELKQNRASWQKLTVDHVMARICEEIGMSTTLWTSIKEWVTDIASKLKKAAGRRALGNSRTAGALLGEK